MKQSAQQLDNAASAIARSEVGPQLLGQGGTASKQFPEIDLAPASRSFTYFALTLFKDEVTNDWLGGTREHR